MLRYIPYYQLLSHQISALGFGLLAAKRFHCRQNLVLSRIYKHHYRSLNQNTYSTFWTPAKQGENKLSEPSVSKVNIAGCGIGKKNFNSLTTINNGYTKFGEDACFISSHGSAYVVGVADGVGGWNEIGIDPSVFSLSLVVRCEEIVRNGEFEPKRPDLLINSAFDKLKVSPRPIGSSTVCVLVVSDGFLYSANLGDSGFVVCRDGKIVHRSTEQVHYFNAPFQLSLLPESHNGDDDSVNLGYKHLQDGPEKIELKQIQLAPNDIVVLATDGLWDNLHDSVITELASGLESSQSMLEDRCESLVLSARQHAIDSEYLSPFAVKARKHGIRRMIGGKPDDTTLIMIQIL